MPTPQPDNGREFEPPMSDSHLLLIFPSKGSVTIILILQITPRPTLNFKNSMCIITQTEEWSPSPTLFFLTLSKFCCCFWGFRCLAFTAVHCRDRQWDYIVISHNSYTVMVRSC